MLRRITDALWKIILGAVIGFGLMLIPVVICQGQGPQPPNWDGALLPKEGIELEVVTVTIDVDTDAVLTYTDPYTNVIEIPTGAVTDTAVVTLTSLIVPRHPPTPPWSIWVGQAFELWATRPISKPVTATVHHYNDPGRWILMRWETEEDHWSRTPTTLDRQDDRLVARIYRHGEFVVARAAHHLWLPAVIRGGTP
jgi:hypothetical protein